MQSYFCSSDDNSSNNSALRRISTLSFNKTIAHYNCATFASSVAYYFVDPSKIFLPFGALHNLFEMAILISFLTGGRIKNTRLILDVALVVEFTRIYLNTKYYINNFEQQDLNPDNNDDIEELVENHESYYGVEIPSMGLFSIVITAIGTVIGYIVAFRNGPKDGKHLSLFYTVDSHNNEVQEPIPTITFNRIIVLYNFATFGSAVIFFIYDASKIFVSIAILHNLFELIIILAIISGGKFSSVVEYVLPILYVLTFGGISIFAEFPFDASFFKFQGLILDFALPIIFMNIYLNTRRNLRNDPNYSYSRSGGGSYAAVSEEEEQLLGEESSEDNTRRHRQQVEIPVGKQPVRDELSYKNDTINHPCQLLLLVVASLIHVLGNFVLTLVPFKIITQVFLSIIF
ncbi:15171_t:CDS:2 [Entrophospora sp. SA101]|nr:15171_t:CDS:2 [Entrophospora sp. SA101]